MGVSYAANAVVRTGAERLTLIRRTYLLVFASILVTMVGAAFGFTQPQIMDAVNAHPFISFLIVFAPLWMAGRMDTTFPANVGFMFLFTFIMGLWLSPLLYFFARTQPGVITEAAVLTGSTFGVLTAYAFLSRRDFSAWGGFFITGLWVLIAASLINLFVQNVHADLWLAAMTVFIFSGLLVFRTWQIRNVYGPDQYVQAAIGIYMALINMFLAILRIVGGGRRS
jgi:FtsH-binding integral membrane protein